jgi:secondary thiamine-phosphate synthase enzyme
MPTGEVRRQFAHVLEVRTAGRGLVELTREVVRWVEGSGCRLGLLTLFVRHTSASLLVQENADPAVRGDLERWFGRTVPDGDPLFSHDQEGADDMPAHIRSALTQTQLTIPLVDGRLVLGTWQGIFLWEHRRRGHAREVVLHLIGD